MVILPFPRNRNPELACFEPRSLEGARTQRILVSVLRTCWQQSQDAFVLLVSLLRSPRAAILDIVPGPG